MDLPTIRLTFACCRGCQQVSIGDTKKEPIHYDEVAASKSVVARLGEGYGSTVLQPFCLDCSQSPDLRQPRTDAFRAEDG